MTTIYHLIVKGGNSAAHHYYTSLTALHLAHADILPSKYTLDRATFPIIREGWEVRKSFAFSANDVRTGYFKHKPIKIQSDDNSNGIQPYLHPTGGHPPPFPALRPRSGRLAGGRSGSHRQ